jgi:2-dehydropantoate 2-reductase
VVRDAEADVLWGKLALLAPLALGTSSAGRPLGAARQDAEVGPLMLAATREVCAVAAAEGARLDAERVIRSLLDLPDHMRSSMQRDIEAGRQSELHAIAGPVLRCGREHGIPTPAVAELARRIDGTEAAL